MANYKDIKGTTVPVKSGTLPTSPYPQAEGGLFYNLGSGEFQFLGTGTGAWATGANLELEIGDATTPDYSGSGTTASTGGGIYKVAVSQFQFTQTPGTEDRWAFSIQFVSEWRAGIS